jgi:hypothetical protein
VFRPVPGKPPIWDKYDAPSDVYMHLPELTNSDLLSELLATPVNQWWDPMMRKYLPFSLEEKRKQCLSIMRFDHLREPFDMYHDQYHPYKLSVVSDTFTFKEVSHSVRDYMPNCETEYR